ncbi:hypothetical protein ACWEQ4_01165 [Rhodococcus sp. NPDC003994]
MGKPLSAAHKRKISEALKARNAGRAAAVSGFHTPAGPSRKPTPAPVRKPEKPAPAAPSAPRLRSPEQRVDDAEQAILRTYANLKPEPDGSRSHVRLSRLRTEVGAGVSKQDFDAAVLRIARQQGASFIPEENQKTLTAEDRAGAINMGNQDRHLFALQGHRHPNSRDYSGPLRRDAPAPRQPRPAAAPDAEREQKNRAQLGRAFREASAGEKAVATKRFRNQFDMSRAEYNRALASLEATGEIRRTARGIIAN